MRAVAATLASVAVFASLLVSNLIVYYAESQRLSMTRIANLEGGESVLGTVLVSEGVYGALSHVQQRLVEDPPRCSSWEQYMGSLSSTSRYSGSTRALQYELVVDSAGEDTGLAADNLTLLHPFDGGSPGSLNLRVGVRLNETAGGLPSYTLKEAHEVHLPVPLSISLSLCRGLMSDIQRSVSRTSCSRLPSVSRVDGLAAAYSQLARSRGLSLDFSRWFVRADGCWMLYYSFTLSQGSVEGPSGPFAWRISDSGFA